jgi:hypothetical protein
LGVLTLYAPHVFSRLADAIWTFVTSRRNMAARA